MRAITKLAAASALIWSQMVCAQEMPDDVKLQDKIGEIQRKYEPQIEALKAEGEATAKDLPGPEGSITGIDIKMKRVDLYVRIPDLDGVREQAWYVRVPEFRMVSHRVVWHAPEPCMKYHRFPWGGGMDLPDICMREKDWRYDLPEVVWREQKWVIGVPQISMRQHRWSFDVPDTVKSSKKEISDVKAKAESIDRRTQELTNAMSAEISGAIREYLTEARKQVAARFDPQVKVLQALLAVAPDQAKDELIKQLADLQKTRDDALKIIDDELAKVS
jgi:hypothetical protein